MCSICVLKYVYWWQYWQTWFIFINLIPSLWFVLFYSSHLGDEAAVLWMKSATWSTWTIDLSDRTLSSFDIFQLFLAGRRSGSRRLTYITPEHDRGTAGPSGHVRTKRARLDECDLTRGVRPRVRAHVIGCDRSWHQQNWVSESMRGVLSKSIIQSALLPTTWVKGESGAIL